MKQKPKQVLCGDIQRYSCCFIHHKLFLLSIMKYKKVLQKRYLSKQVDEPKKLPESSGRREGVGEKFGYRYILHIENT